MPLTAGGQCVPWPYICDGGLTTPVALKLAGQRHPADRLTACSRHALKAGPVCLDRGSADRIDDPATPRVPGTRCLPTSSLSSGRSLFEMICEWVADGVHWSSDHHFLG